MHRITPKHQQPELATHQDHLGRYWEELPSGAWRVYKEPGIWERAEPPAQTWPLSSERIDVVGQNGNTGEHYDIERLQKENERLKSIMSTHLKAWRDNDNERIAFALDEMKKAVNP